MNSPGEDIKLDARKISRDRTHSIIGIQGEETVDIHLLTGSSPVSISPVRQAFGLASE